MKNNKKQSEKWAVMRATACELETSKEILSEQCFDFIDLGLPSGRLWADRNVGADSPEDFGVYLTFDMAEMFGEGGDWRTPTREDFEELCRYCTYEWSKQNGVYGRLFKSVINGNTVFFPAAGNGNGTSLYNAGTSGSYWSRSLVSGGTSGYYLGFISSAVTPASLSYRFNGFSVRAVQ